MGCAGSSEGSIGGENRGEGGGEDVAAATVAKLVAERLERNWRTAFLVNGCEGSLGINL